MLFTALADALYQGADTTEVCAAICMAATLLVPDCDHASVLMRRNDDFVTALADLRAIVTSRNLRGEPQQQRYAALLADLLRND